MIRNSRGSGRGRRDLRSRVRNARGRSPSSTRWLSRQINDHYVRRAVAEGYRSRSAFKLLELDDRFGFLKSGTTIVDLGCVPGGWCQVAAERVNSLGKRRSQKTGCVLGVDRQPMKPLQGVTFRQLDCLDHEAALIIADELNDGADTVMSDMSPAVTGHRQTDHLRIIALCESASELATAVLNPGGTLILKVFSGGAESGLQSVLKQNFTRVKTAKPPSSRKESPEKFVVARGFRGGTSR